MRRPALPAVAVLCLSITAGLAAPPALAQKANQLGSLLGAKSAGAESDLESRGYVYITGHSTNSDTKMSYYWNNRIKNCVRVETGEGRVQNLVDTSAGDCNQKEGMSSGEKAAAAAIIGAAIIAAASHKSGHHDDGKHYTSQADDAQYDRGFNDGLHNMAYHNYDRNDAYSSGYGAGVAQRNRNTSYHSGQGGYAQVPRFRSTVGAESIRGIDMMSEMGFNNVDSLESGNTQYGIYYHPASRTCVQLTMADGRVLSADDIHTHPKCR